MSIKTTVNDNRTDYSDVAQGTERATQARRLAASLPRNDDRIERVGSSVTHTATIWVSAPEPADFDAPEGYTVTDTMETNGSVCLWVDN